MRRIVTLMVIFGLWAPGTASAAELLVVFDIQDSSHRFRKGDLSQLSDYLAAKMVEARTYRVVPRARVTAQVSKRQKKPCADWECQAAVAWQLKASKVLSTTLLKLGRKCTVVATLYDVKSAASVASANIRCGCTTDDLVSAVDQVPAVLSGKAVAKPVATTRPVHKQPRSVKKQPRRVKKQPRAATQKAPAVKKQPRVVAKPRKATPPDEPGLVALSKRSVKTHRAATGSTAKPRKPFPMWPGLVAAGVGVVGLGVGIPLLAIDGNPTDCLGEALPDNSNCARLYDTKAAGWTFTALGITALAASGVLFYFNLKSRSAESKDNSGIQVVTVTPLGEGGVALGAVGRF